MSRKKVSAESQIIALFTGLTDTGKQMVMFGLNAIMSNESPKSPAPAVTKQSSPKRGAQKSTASTETKTEGASSAGVKCIAKLPGLDVECGELADALIHDPKGGYASYHEFEAPKSKKAAAQK